METHSPPPPPPSLVAQQAAQAIHTTHLGAPLLFMRPMQERQVQRPCVHSRLPLGMLSHFAPWNRRPCMALSCSGWRPFRYFYHRALIHWMYRELCQCFKYKYKKSLYLRGDWDTGGWSPLQNHIHLGEAGWTIWEAIHAPFLSII